MVLLYLIKLPESVRWAWAVGKIDTANKIIAKMSEVNNVEIPEEFLLKQKPKLLPKSEAGMGSLIASNELRGNYSMGASINYVGKILPIFDPPPRSVGKFTT